MSLRNRPRQLGTAVILGVALTLGATACAGGTTATSSIGPAPSHLSGTVSFWHFFTDQQAKDLQSIVDDFEKANPDVKVQVHGGQSDDKMRKAITSSHSVDVYLSPSSDPVGSFCSTGVFKDLGPYITRDGVDLHNIPQAELDYTQFKGKQCSLPVQADTYGLYYNKKMLEAAGFTSPPKTMAEFLAMDKKLTTFNADGSIKTIGFDPLMGWYQNIAAHYAALSGAKWFDAKGKSSIASDPAWTELITWQKALVDQVGYDKLQAFTASLGQQSSASNAFFTGKVAMTMDGEYRISHINELAPDLDYGTAPFPTLPGHEDLFGGGYITGNVAGIAKSSQHTELAWALLKYLATDTHAVVKLSNLIQNIPTTLEALKSPDLKVSAPLRTFITIAASGKTQTTPPTVLGPAYQQILDTYWQKYQAGDGGDLHAGLVGVDKAIDDAYGLATGP